MTTGTTWWAQHSLRSVISRAGVLLVCLVVFAAPALAADYALVEWGGTLPGDAVRAGVDSGGAPLHVCVASGWDGHHPGALTDGGRCLVAWGGQQHEFDSGFQVLASGSSPDGDWQQVSEGQVPDNAFRAGGDDSGPLLVCRVDAWGGTIPGKLTESGWCYVAHAGEEHYFTGDYEVLVE